MRTVSPPREEDFRSPLRSPTVASRVGVWLGLCFAVAFLTGLVSHYAYAPDPALPFPTRPTWGYRVTQGLHVASGTAAIPLLLVKLWSVFPRLFAHIPRHGRELAVTALERGSIAVLVATAVFQLASGLANTAQWYPWDFTFRATHYAVAWITIGALIVHIAVKLPLIRSTLLSPLEATTHDRVSPADSTDAALSRRALLRTTWLASLAAVVLSAGSTVPLLRRVSLFGVRSGDGPQGIPINKSAAAARVVALALSPDYRLSISYAGEGHSFTRDELLAMPQTTRELPIACVEGWSASGRWTGVRLRDLLDSIGAPPGHDVRVTSLQPSGPFRVTTMEANFADDDSTLLALALEGEPLALDHGYPCRIITANRPGVLQTKWVATLEVT